MKYLKSLILAAFLMLTVPTWAAELTLEQATAIAKKRTGGRVLAAQVRQMEGREMYVIKILDPKGHIRKLFIDPKQ